MTLQELHQFVQNPQIAARIQENFDLSPKTLEKVLANPSANERAYNSIMSVVKKYYEEQIIIFNQQVFYQNQIQLEKIAASELKPSRTLSNASQHVFEEPAEKQIKPKDEQTTWELLKKLQNEIQALQAQHEEAQQELEAVVTEKEKVIEQIAAVERLSKLNKTQVQDLQNKDVAIARTRINQEIKDFALVQRDRIDKGMNLSPKEVKEFKTNEEYSQHKMTEFTVKKVGLEEKEVQVVNKMNFTRNELNEKYEQHNSLQTTPAFRNAQLQPYQLTPNLSISQKVENFIEETVNKIFKTPSWMKSAKAQINANKKAEEEEKEIKAHENQMAFRPMAAPAA